MAKHSALSRMPLLALAAWVCLLFGTTQSLALDTSSQQVLAENVVSRIIDFHERTTDVTYPVRRIPVRFAKPNELSTSEAAWFNTDVAPHGEIVLNQEFISCDFAYLGEHLEDSSFPASTNCTSGGGVPVSLSFVREVLSHELAHGLTKYYINTRVSDSWLAPFFRKERTPGLQDFDAIMVAEGIAEHFGSLFGSHSLTPIADSAWKLYKDEEDFKHLGVQRFFFYQGGHSIVAPVLKAQREHNGLLWLLRNELRIKLPDLGPAHEYREAGIRFKSEVLDVQLTKAKILNEVFPLLSQNDRDNLLQKHGASPLSSYEKLRELQVLRRDSYPLAPVYLTEWFYLLDQGASVSALVDVDHMHLIPIVRQFENGMAPKVLLSMMRERRYEVAWELSRKDPDYVRGAEWNRTYIVNKLHGRKHVFRVPSEHDIDYAEDESSVLELQDRALLQLVKLFVDYVDSPLGRRELSDLIKVGSREETGGVLVWNDRITILPVGNFHDGNRDNGWLPPMVHAYSSALGIVHTHPLTEGIDPPLVAGPSGFAKLYTPNMQSDMMAFRYYARMGNPYAVHMVVTALYHDEYNVDIYFRDLVESPRDKNKVTHARYISVLDLGVFKVLP